jgi:RHS repeat-associated protein
LIDNRVDGVTLRLFRVGQVIDEAGMWTRVTYNGANCPDLAPAAGWVNNSQFCFPRWTVNGNSVGWGTFGVFPVKQVRLTDLTGRSPDRLIRYDYDTPAYRRSDSPFNSKKTWSEFQGFASTTTWTTNSSGDLVSPPVRHQFFQGMDGDSNGAGGAKSVSRNVPIATASGEPATITATSTAVTDSNWLTGVEFAATTYDDITYNNTTGNYDLGTFVARSSSHPETQAVPGVPFGVSRWWLRRTDYTRSANSGTHQWTRTRTVFDGDGRTESVRSAGDFATGSDDTCVRLTYGEVANPDLTQLVTASATYKDSGNCPSTTVLASSASVYDGRGRPISNTVYSTGLSTGGRTTTTTYDGLGRVTGTNGPVAGNSDQTTITYAEPAGQTRTQSTTPNGVELETATALNLWSGQPKTVTDANGGITRYTYDSLDRLTEVRTPLEGTGADPVVRFEYTASVLSVNFNTGTFSATPSRVRTLVDPGTKPGTTTAYPAIPSVVYYDGFGQAVQQDNVAAIGRLVSITRYDAAGRAIAKTDPQGVTGAPGAGIVAWTAGNGWLGTRVEYDIFGRPTNQTRSVGETGSPVSNIRIVYDGDRSVTVRPDSATDSPRRTHEVFNARGELVRRDVYFAATEYNRTTYTYTELGQSDTVVTPGVAGDTVLTTAARTTTYDYNLAGEQVSVDDPNHGKWVYTYNSQGQIASFTNSRGQTLNYMYDGAGRKTQISQGFVIFAQFGYDKLPDETIGVTPSSNNRGQLAWQTSFTFGTKVTTENSRDRRGRVVSTTVDIADHSIGGLAPTTVSAATAGLLTPMDFTYESTYDKADRQVTMTTPSIPGITGTYLGGETVVTGYDDVGRTTTLRRATVTGNTIDYGASYAGQPSFDDDGRLITRPLGSGSYTYRAERSYGWDQFGRLSRMIANTVTGTSESPTLAQVQDDTLAYDAYGNVTSLVSDVPGSSLDERQCFKYNTRQQLVRAYSIALQVPASGSTPARPTTCADTSPESTNAPFDQSYDYDAANRMTKGPAGHTYTYDRAAHPHGVTRTVSGGPSVGTRNLDYDNDGNVIEIEREGINTHQMTWDPQGRLTSTTVKNPAGVVQSTIRNIYDIDRQRLISTTDNPGTADDTVTVTLPGLDFTIGRDTQGDRSMISANDYKTIGGANVAIRSRTGSAAVTVQWVLGNYQGSVALTINATTGDIARRWYTPYGNEREATGTTTSDRAFLNQEKDTTGVSYLTNRYYDPRIGVFLSVDPLVGKTGQPYAYGSGSPTTFSDASGLEPCSLEGSCTSADYGPSPTTSSPADDGPRCRRTCEAPDLAGKADQIRNAASDAGVDAALLGAIFAHERISYNAGLKDQTTDLLKIQWMDFRRMMTGDVSPSIGYTQVDLPTFAQTLKNHPSIALDGRALEDDFWMKAEWMNLLHDEDYSIRVAAFVLADNEASIRSRFQSLDVAVLSNGTIDVDSARPINISRLVGASYNISIDNLTAAFSAGSYDPALGDKYVYSQYASNRQDQAWQLTWSGAL